MSTSNTTTDLIKIQQWAEARNGKPARVKSTGTDDEGGGVLRINFPAITGDQPLQDLTWDEWYRIFEARNLAFSYHEKNEIGELSNYFRLVEREG